MYHTGWDWFWMTTMMGAWIALIGLVAYIVVKLAQGRSQGGTH